jgi:hypothetical protein
MLKQVSSLSVHIPSSPQSDSLISETPGAGPSEQRQQKQEPQDYHSLDWSENADELIPYEDLDDPYEYDLSYASPSGEGGEYEYVDANPNEMVHGDDEPHAVESGINEHDVNAPTPPGLQDDEPPKLIPPRSISHSSKRSFTSRAEDEGESENTFSLGGSYLVDLIPTLG